MTNFAFESDMQRIRQAEDTGHVSKEKIAEDRIYCMAKHGIRPFEDFRRKWDRNHVEQYLRIYLQPVHDDDIAAIPELADRIAERVAKFVK